MSNADLWSNVATGAFTLGGALVGALGSWLAATKASEVATKASEAARKQAQQDRVHVRRDEVISESYARMLALDDAYLSIVMQSGSSDKGSKQKELDQFLSDVGDGWLPHFRKNLPWIPELVANKMIRIVHVYQRSAMELRESLDEVSEAKLPEILADEHSRLKAMKEVEDLYWLRFDIRAALGIEEARNPHPPSTATTSSDG